MTIGSSGDNVLGYIIIDHYGRNLCFFFTGHTPVSEIELGFINNKIKIIDEISVDGMRLKDLSGDSFDKDVFRNTGDLDSAIDAYKQALERIEKI